MGIWAVWRSNRRWRSSPAVTVALTRKRSLPTSTVASGCAIKLWYHAGCLGAPANEAITTRRSPSVVYTKGVVSVRPLLAPVIVKSSTGIGVAISTFETLPARETGQACHFDLL